MQKDEALPQWCGRVTFFQFSLKYLEIRLGAFNKLVCLVSATVRAKCSIDMNSKCFTCIHQWEIGLKLSLQFPQKQTPLLGTRVCAFHS